jgi:hypothetical protein
VAACASVLGYEKDYELVGDDAAVEGGTPDVSGESDSEDDAPTDPPIDAPTDVPADASLRGADAAMPDSAGWDAAQAGTDAGLDAAKDAGADAVTASVTCDGEECNAAHGQGCCYKPLEQCTTLTACSLAGGSLLTCDGPEDCAAGQACCVAAFGGILAQCVDAGMCSGGIACHVATRACDCLPAGIGCAGLGTCGGKCM